MVAAAAMLPILPSMKGLTAYSVKVPPHRTLPALLTEAGVSRSILLIVGVSQNS
jgi:hypothetical protein